MAQVFEGAPNEARPFPLGGSKNWLASLKDLRSNSMLSLFEMTTTTEEICNGVVAMGKTLLSCCLCGEIMARWHGPALAMQQKLRKLNLEVINTFFLNKIGFCSEK
jgi:hypothetical protein